MVVQGRIIAGVSLVKHNCLPQLFHSRLEVPIYTLLLGKANHHAVDIRREEFVRLCEQIENGSRLSSLAWARYDGMRREGDKAVPCHTWKGGHSSMWKLGLSGAEGKSVCSSRTSSTHPSATTSPSVASASEAVAEKSGGRGEHQWIRALNEARLVSPLLSCTLGDCPLPFNTPSTPSALLVTISAVTQQVAFQ